MRAAQVVRLDGPEGVEIREVEEPTRTREDDVLVEVHSVGVAFPDLLLSRGHYQLRPELPFTLGADFSGTVIAGPDRIQPGRRVVGVLPHGAAAERVVVPVSYAFPMPATLGFDEAAALPMNYLTADFALSTRARVAEGETVLVNGASGGLGIACLQIAKGLKATTIGVCSTPEKEGYARAHGADHSVSLDGFKEAVLDLTGGRGVDVIVDVIGGDYFLDGLRTLAPLGRLLVLGFAAGQGIPTVKVNRLLLNNIDVRGVAWGEYSSRHPEFLHHQWSELLPLVAEGFVRPPVTRTFDLADFPEALGLMAARRLMGKAVVRLRH